MIRFGSLKLRLLAGVLATTTVVWSGLGAFAYWETRVELEELLDAHLAQSAALLVSQLGEDASEIELEHAPQLHRYARHVAFQVWASGKRLLLRSSSAPKTRLSLQNNGFSFGEVEGQRWRVFSTWSSRHETLIQVGELLASRQEVSHEIVFHLLIPVLVSLPVLGILLALAIGRGLRPLNRLAGEVGARDPDRLEPIGLGHAPKEVRPLLNQLNALFERIKTSLENERRFTADASHELRTPIAAIRTQAQVAQAAADPGERRHALEQVIAGCDRTTRLTEQLLTLARLDAAPFFHCHTKADLPEAARQVLADLGPSAYAKHIELNLDTPRSVTIDCDEALLQVLIRNLVDNAIRYSPPESQIQVVIVSERSGARLQVVDQGPGIPEEEKQRVLDRFYRVLGSDSSGSGLGLSIVGRIVNLLKAKLDLSTGPHGSGLMVTIEFPSANRVG